MNLTYKKNRQQAVSYDFNIFLEADDLSQDVILSETNKLSTLTINIPNYAALGLNSGTINLGSGLIITSNIEIYIIIFII